MFVATGATEAEPLRGTCSSLRLVSPEGTYGVITPAFRAELGGWNVESGAWITRVLVDRCGTQVKHRILVRATGNNQLEHTRLLPGDFQGDLVLERDVSTLALSAFAAIAKCDDAKNVHVLDIKNESNNLPADWSKTWTVRACGKLMVGLVNYAKPPDRPGITFAVGNIKEVQRT